MNGRRVRDERQSSPRVHGKPVGCQKSIATESCCVPIVEIENATEPLSSHDAAVPVNPRLDYKPIAKPLVVSLEVIVLDILGNQLAQMPLAEWYDAPQAFLAEGAHSSFREGVQVRASGRQLDDLYARGLEDFVELLREHRVMVVNEISHVA
jgi:hypothetical protein